MMIPRHWQPSDPQLELQLYQDELDLDNHVDARGIRYIGKARQRNDGKWEVLADLHGALCIVEVIITRKT